MGTIALARGIPPPECLPVEALADCARAAIAADGERVLNYGPVGGYEPLRAWVAERHGVDEGRVLLTNGSLQAFALLAEHLADGAAPVAVEAPTYDRPLKLLARIGAPVLSLPLGEDGLEREVLEAALEGLAPAFLYTIPTFQNPSGRTIPASVRRRLVELARARGLLVLEDDPYGQVRFEGEPPPTLHELAGGDGIVYLSSFSKIVAPGVRVGYAILPAQLVEGVGERATQTYLAPSFLAQATVWEFVRRGLLEPHLELVCSLLRERRDAMVEALERHLAPFARWSTPEGGYFLWLDFDPEIDAAELLGRAAADGVTFVPGSDFHAGAGGISSARLAFSFASPAEIARGVERLGELVRSLAAPVLPVSV
ncbi:MAG: PLP-dependent aminotransferase family protein [Gaiellaceae bacterium]